MTRIIFNPPLHILLAFMAATVLVSCAHAPNSSRNPASSGPSGNPPTDLVRTGELTISSGGSNGDYRLVLIANDRSGAGGVQEFDAEALGFKSPSGASLRNIDPKFLITVDPDGAQEVYSFELGTFLERQHDWAPTEDGSSGISRYYLNIHP